MGLEEKMLAQTIKSIYKNHFIDQDGYLDRSKNIAIAAVKENEKCKFLFAISGVNKQIKVIHENLQNQFNEIFSESNLNINEKFELILCDDLQNTLGVKRKYMDGINSYELFKEFSYDDMEIKELSEEIEEYEKQLEDSKLSDDMKKIIKLKKKKANENRGRIYSTQNNIKNRFTCAERKILEYLKQEFIEKQVMVEKVHMCTYFAPCDSCGILIEELKKIYKDIKLKVSNVSYENSIN